MKIRSRCRFIVATLLVESFAIPAFSQQTQENPVKLKTQLVEVRAVITNKQGQPVTNLKKEDFEVLENGKPQSISFFSAEQLAGERNPQHSTLPSSPSSPSSPDATTQSNSTSGPGQQARRTVAMFVDTLTMGPDSVVRAKTALTGFIDKKLTQEDEVGLIATSGKLAMKSQFASDKRVLNYLINSLSAARLTKNTLFTPYLAHAIVQGEPGAAEAGQAVLFNEEMRPVSTDEVRMRASTTLNEADFQRKQTLRLLEAVIQRLASAPGQRMIVLLSDGLSSQDPFQGNASDLQVVTSIAARSGVTIYSIDTIGLETNTLPANFSVPVSQTPVIIDVGSSSQRSPSSSGSGSSGGGGGGKGGGKGSSPPPPPPRENVSAPPANMAGPPVIDFLRNYVSGSANDLRAGLKILADETGGESFVDSNDIGGSLDKTLADSASYYALAYYPEDLQNKHFRKITVKVKDHSDYNIRAQKGYTPLEPKTEAGAKTPMERLQKAMEEPFPVEGIPVETWAEYFERDGEKGQVYLHSRFAWEGTGASESSGQLHFKLTLASVVYDPGGNIVDQKVNDEEGSIKAEKMAEAKREGFVESRQVNLKPGLYLVRAGITEEGTDKVGTALLWLKVPDITNKQMALSTLLLGGDPAETRSGAQQHPLVVASHAIRSQATRVFKTGDLMNFDFKVYNPPEEKGGKSPLQMQYEFLRDGQSVGHSSWQPIAARQVGKDSKGLELAGGLKLNGIPPGSYILRVTVWDTQGTVTVQSETPFVVVNQ